MSGRAVALASGLALAAVLLLALALRETRPARSAPAAAAVQVVREAPPSEPASPRGTSSAPHPAETASARASRSAGEAGVLDLITREIDGMTRDEVVEALVGLTGGDRERFEELRSPHAFGQSLAAAILAGWGSAPATIAPLRVSFSTRSPQRVPASADRTTFESTTTRIFGSFPMEPGADITVLAKWYRVEPHQFLLLEELPVRERDGQGFIRLDRRDGWPEARYRVEVYESSERVVPIASGEYQTFGYAKPRQVAFH